MQPGHDLGRAGLRLSAGRCESLCESVSELRRQVFTLDWEPPGARAWGRSNSTTVQSASRSHC